ncbi:MAG: caspase family protein, partial [Pseudonocardiaceae bacterium]
MCVVRRNPRSVDAFMRDLTNACAAASDVLFVYYAGHGVLDSRMRLNLALRRTDPVRPEGNAVPLQMVKEQVETARARVRVIVLDCCFSGQALGRQSAAAVIDEAAAAAGKVVDTDVRGMYVLTSTEATEMGRYVVGEPHTAFTDALLAAINAGGDGTGREVRLGELFASTQQTLQRRQLPLPRCRQDDTSGNLVIRRGRAVSGDVASGVGAAAKPVTGQGRGRALLAGVAVAVAAVVALILLNPSPVSETPVAPGTAPVVPFTPVGNAVFSDDFSAPALDPEKWLAPEASGVVGQSGGQLRFVVRPGAEINTSLEPVTLTRAFEQMTFDVTIPQYAKAGPGGVALILNPLRGWRPSCPSDT